MKLLALKMIKLGHFIAWFSSYSPEHHVKFISSSLKIDQPCYTLSRTNCSHIFSRVFLQEFTRFKDVRIYASKDISRYGREVMSNCPNLSLFAVWTPNPTQKANKGEQPQIHAGSRLVKGRSHLRQIFISEHCGD